MTIQKQAVNEPFYDPFYNSAPQHYDDFSLLSDLRSSKLWKGKDEQMISCQSLKSPVAEKPECPVSKSVNSLPEKQASIHLDSKETHDH